MFGMLDYRAHKLFLIIFAVPLFVFTWAFIIGRPVLAVLIADDYFSSIPKKTFGAIGIMIGLELVLLPISWAAGKFVRFVFKLLVDVIAADGRTEEEAEAVALGGEKVIVRLKMNRHPSEWDEQSMSQMGNLDWVSRLFFKHKIDERVSYIKQRYEELDQEEGGEYGRYPYSETIIIKLLKEGGLAPPSAIEKFVCDKTARLMTYPYIIFLVLLVINILGDG